MNPAAPAPIPVQSETLRALMAEGRREWSVTEPWFYLLLALMAIDTLLGLLYAYHRRDIASGALFDGLRKKVTMILVVAAMVMLDPFVPGLTISTIAAVAYVGMETLSITEQSAKLGVPIPEGVTRALRAMRQAEGQPVHLVGQNAVAIQQPPPTPCPSGPRGRSTTPRPPDAPLRPKTERHPLDRTTP